MEHFDSLLDINIKVPTAITIGKFDGIHKGHHLLISEIISKKSAGLYPCVITFKKSPRIILSKDKTSSLFTNEERDYILEKNGINYLITCEFNKKFMEIKAIQFIEILCKNLNMKYLVVGSDFTFGYKGEGNVELLKKISNKNGFELKIINKIKKDNQYISSSFIREELIKGNIDMVNEMLGYEYFIIGKATHEKCSKNKFGIFPISILPTKDKLIPKFGIYETKIYCEGNIYNGITKIGKNIIDNRDYKCSEDEIQIETYCMELKTDIYGKMIRLSFKKLYDKYINFCSIEEFKEQMKYC